MTLGCVQCLTRSVLFAYCDHSAGVGGAYPSSDEIVGFAGEPQALFTFWSVHANQLGHPYEPLPVPLLSKSQKVEVSVSPIAL